MGARPAAVALLPASPGVYRFRDDRGRPLYLGRAGDLRRRVSSYWGDLRGRSHLRRMVPQIARIEALVWSSEHEAAWAERMLLEHRMPRWNRIRGGLEVPLYLRLDGRTPSITTAHEVVEGRDVRWYGPYLGGTATRLALAGLERVYALGYSRAGLTGSARDMARVRGVDGVDPSSVVEAVDRVLRRDPDAVATARLALTAARDAASSTERYEVAARIQEELGGLDWVTSSVRVVGTPDLDLSAGAGADGVSLSFRTGRLRTWEPGPRVGVDVDGPEDWHDFLVLNSRLAAQLAASPVR